MENRLINRNKSFLASATFAANKVMRTKQDMKVLRDIKCPT